MNKFFASVIMVLLLGACGTDVQELTHVSPDAKTKITIHAQRTSSIEAWQVTMRVKAHQYPEDQVAFEVYASEITSHTVRFDWEDETHCRITFTQRDNSTREFMLTSTPENVQLSGGQEQQAL